MLMTIGKNMILSFQKPIFSQFYLSIFKYMASHDKIKLYSKVATWYIGLAEFFWSSCHWFIFWWAALLSFCKRWLVFLHWIIWNNLFTTNTCTFLVIVGLPLCWRLKFGRMFHFNFSNFWLCFLFFFLSLFHFVEFKKP